MIFCSGIGIAWSMAAIFWAAQGEKFLVPVGRWVPVKDNHVVGNPGPLSIACLSTNLQINRKKINVLNINVLQINGSRDYSLPITYVYATVRLNQVEALPPLLASCYSHDFGVGIHQLEHTFSKSMALFYVYKKRHYCLSSKIKSPPSLFNPDYSALKFETQQRSLSFPKWPTSAPSLLQSISKISALF
jgi:hypothetical protein